MNLKFGKFATYIVLATALTTGAFASCGDSLTALAAAAAAASIHSPSRSTPHGAQPQGDLRVAPSIVGLWDIQFVVGDQTIQEAYQLWNIGGTEIHNPNVDPRTGNVCLGVWKGSNGVYTLTHRVWNYDSNGTFLGTIHLSETLTVGSHGGTHSGSFTLDFYDPSGNFLSELAGTVQGTRIPVD
jgi:hypothetical protein